MKNHHYAVIMAGGSGTRLWPLSRKDAPKQFQKLVSEKTLIQETYDRLAKFIPDDQIYVATVEQYKNIVLEQLPKLTEDRIFLEPEGKNTTPAFALIASMLYERDKEAIVATAPSDHVINNSAAYIKAYKTAFKIMDKSQGSLLTIGIKPDKPHTGLGYIKMGKMVTEVDDEKVFEIDEFKEKPDLKTAVEYLKSWQYMWNSACYFWYAADMIKWLKKVRPEMMKGIDEIMKLSDVAGNGKKIKEIYHTFENEQIEYSMVESMNGVQVLPADLGWSDVGTWSTLQEMLCNKYDTCMISKGNHLDYESDDILVYGNEKLIATLGLKDIIIVDSPDALLVMNKAKSEDIKKLLDKMKKENKHSYL